MTYLQTDSELRLTGHTPRAARPRRLLGLAGPMIHVTNSQCGSLGSDHLREPLTLLAAPRATSRGRCRAPHQRQRLSKRDERRSAHSGLCAIGCARCVAARRTGRYKSGTVSHTLCLHACLTRPLGSVVFASERSRSRADTERLTSYTAAACGGTPIVPSTMTAASRRPRRVAARINSRTSHSAPCPLT